MTRSYSGWRLEKLSDPKRAARYLNAAKKDSKEAFLHALKNVIQANQVAKVAREAGVSRESVYRSFSAEGNPTFDTFSAVLEAVDIDFSFVPILHSAEAGEETSKGNVSTLGYLEAGAVKYRLPQVVNVVATGATPFSCSWQPGVAAPSTVDLQEQIPGGIPVYLLTEENGSGAYNTAAAGMKLLRGTS
jgi:probable addiction module antidote protein